jgi:DNA invertase Pin-like site-specific DNA recombinase
VSALFEELVHQQACHAMLVKQGLSLDLQKRRDVPHEILSPLFAMLAELERDFVFERTNEGLRGANRASCWVSKLV